MQCNQDYVVDSLELHLFFARIMKEHALFLKAGFMPPGAAFARESEMFLRRFEAILSRAVSLSNHIVRRCVLDSGEVFTRFTDKAECRTQRLTGIAIDRQLTARAMCLSGSDCGAELCVDPRLSAQVCRLNRDALAQVEGLIALKERILQQVCSCCLFTANYPLLIGHTLREAELYRARLRELEGMKDCGCPEGCGDEKFWNRIMMEHALFIRGLLDPCEEALIASADGFAGDYKRLLDGSARGGAEELTRKFRDFKAAGTEGIEECKIRSVILPLLADHVLREANHYLRIMGG